MSAFNKCCDLTNNQIEPIFPNAALCMNRCLMKIPAWKQPFCLIARMHGAGGITGFFRGVICTGTFGFQGIGQRVAQFR